MNVILVCELCGVSTLPTCQSIICTSSIRHYTDNRYSINHQLNHLAMRNYTMIELYSELNTYSVFILKQLSSSWNNDVVSIAAKRVLLIKSL
jgi:hypothetical protein